MSDCFPLEKLGKYAYVQGGYAFKSSDFTTIGVPVLKIKNVRARTVDTSDVDYVSENIAKIAECFYLKNGDILISMTGSGPNAPNSVVGRVARYTRADNQALLNQRVGRFVSRDPKRLDLRYLFFVLSQREYQAQLVSISTGSANQANISGRQIENLDIPIARISLQNAISSFLGSIDDKIELNRQMNKTMEDIAKAIFKSWFIDFDPVRAKSEGRQPVGISADIANLFPDIFADHKEIPQHWQREALDKMVSLIIDHRGKTPLKLGGKWAVEGIPVLSAKNVKSGNLVNQSSIRFVSEELYSRWMCDKLLQGDILLTSEAPLGEIYWMPPAKDYCLGQRLFALRADPTVAIGSYIYFWLQTVQGQQELKGRATGTTVSGIRQSELRRCRLLCPPLKLQLAFDNLAQPVLLKCASNSEEMQTLSEIRDTLLPKLLSGEIRIKEAEKQLEKVL